MEAATIIVRRSRGILIVQALGKTAKGQSYVKGETRLGASSIRDPEFKAKLATAVDKLLGSSQLTPP